MTRTTAVAEYLYTAGWRPTPHHADAWNDPTTGDRYELREAHTLQHARDARALMLEHPTDRAPLGDGDAGTADLHHAARVDPYLPRDASLLTARRLRALLAALEEAPDAS